jgi:hypothetical protein
MKYFKVLIFTICFRIFGCQSDPCPCTIDFNGVQTGFNTPARFTLSYKSPLLLPFALKYNRKDGLYFEDDPYELVTPLGVFGVEYTVPVGDSEKSINGIPIPKGDYVVALVNKQKNTKQLFAIKEQSKLKVTTSGGETTMEFQVGYAEIDVTKTTIKELNFYDQSKIAIKNDTNKRQYYEILNMAWMPCYLEPKEKKYFKTDVATTVKTITENTKTNERYESFKTLAPGDVCVLTWNNSKQMLDMNKE